MNRVRSILAGAAILAMSLPHGAGAIDVKPLRGLSDRDMSRLGRRVLKAGGRDWVHGETARFIYHAPDIERLAMIEDMAEFSYAKIAEYLPGDVSERKGRIFAVNGNIWSRVLRDADRRRDSLAMQVGDEVFVLDDPSASGLPVRVAHELVHYRAWQLWRGLLPVWLEEGLAGCIGWDVAEAYRRRKGWQLTREAAPGAADDDVTLEAITSVTEYPAAGTAPPAAYRQSEALVRAIARKIGFAKLPEFVGDVAGGHASWDDSLRKRFGFDDYDFEWLREETKRNLGAAEKK